MSYVPNVSGLSTVGPAGKKAVNIMTINPHAIIVGPRQRPLDPERVKELATSILQNGQLQAIGVREHRPKGSISIEYQLLYGAHRLAAINLLISDGRDPEANIWAAIYPDWLSDSWGKLQEIVENLHRKELTPSERAGHTVSYGGWVKKLKLAQPATTKQGKAKTANAIIGVGGSDTNNELPTVTEKVTADLGISRDTVNHRQNMAVQLAAREGVVVDPNAKSIEKMDADKMIEVGAAAITAAAKKKEKAKAAHRGEEGIDPVRPRKATVSTVELNVAQLPHSLVQWCRRRLKDADPNKLLTPAILKATHAALGDLIVELGL